MKKKSKKNRIFLLLGCLMTVFAAAFVMYSLENPEAALNGDNEVTRLMYSMYLAVNAAMFVLFAVTKPSDGK
ncbi:MAG: hypothetical protein LBN42_00315 [Oscillospiraceae bacterium]|jgi:hypothetical protein|nr:hypothetical protein [Oscillospiraceae bacterium]